MGIPKLKKFEPVKVYWIDSMSTSSWGEYSEGNLDCTTVGHFIKNTKDRIVIALNNSLYSSGHYMEIPLVAIRQVKRLKE